MGLLQNLLKEEFGQNQLTQQDQQVLNDIVGSTLNEAVDFNSVIQKVKNYATKGILTAAVLGSLMSSQAFSQQQKQQIKQVAGTPVQQSVEPLNYKPTNDPNIVIGKYGVKITRQEFNKFEQSQKSVSGGLSFDDFNSFANWVGRWAKTPEEINNLNIPIPKFYATYSNGVNIYSSDIFNLIAKGGEVQSTVLNILKHTVVQPGVVPMLGNDDADRLITLIKYYKDIDNKIQTPSSNSNILAANK